jgi:alkaline phosphatase D
MQGAGAAALAAPLVGCGAAGCVTGLVLEVEATRALVTAWSSTAETVEVAVVASDGATVASATLTLDAYGHAILDVTALAPATVYRVSWFASDGASHGPTRFVTAPADDDARPQRLAVSADVDEAPRFATPIFDTIAALNPDLFVSLGDWPYADNGPPAITRDEYEDAHARAQLAPRFQPWRRATSFRCIYDDHEFANDWDAAARAAYPERHAAAQAAWDAWFPRRGEGPRYRSWRWGALVECFLLDCRLYRSANDAPDGPDKTMLGTTQRDWLIAGLRASTATWKLVFTSVPLDFGFGLDHWRGFAFERDRILDELVAPPIAGLVFLSADQHIFAAHVHRHGAREFQFGPLSRDVFPFPDPAPGVLARVATENVGVLDVDADSLRVRAIDAQGNAVYDQRLTRDDLTPRAG